MSRLIRNTAVLVKIETAYGEDSEPTGSANALLVSNLTPPSFDAQNVEREHVRPYLGGSEQLVGTASDQCGFDVELAGSGTPGTAPAWGPLLRACAMAEVDGASIVEYKPRTDGQESVTIYWHDDGVLHKMVGCRGTFVIRAGIGQRPVISFTFTGLHGGPVAASNPTVTLTAFKTPKVVTNENSPGITLGGTYASGSVSGGTAYTSQGIEIDAANEVSYTPLLGEETVDVTGRVMAGSMSLDLDAADEVALFATVKANTLQSVAMEHGTEAGNIVVLFAPKVQLINPAKNEVNGKRLIGYELRLVPDAGNDELTICVK
jgi:hypothetical protein